MTKKNWKQDVPERERWPKTRATAQPQAPFQKRCRGILWSHLPSSLYPPAPLPQWPNPNQNQRGVFLVHQVSLPSPWAETRMEDGKWPWTIAGRKYPAEFTPPPFPISLSFSLYCPLSLSFFFPHPTILLSWPPHFSIFLCLVEKLKCNRDP